MAKHILPKIPPHHCYSEPFAGAAWIFFKKSPSKVEILNDLNGEISNLYQVIQTDLQGLLAAMRWKLCSRAEFMRLKSLDVTNLSPQQRAVRLLYLIKTCYGGKVADSNFCTSITRGPKFGPQLVPVLEAAHARLAKAYIENLPYHKAIAKADSQGTFFYIDPPYCGMENYYGPGLFTRADFASLATQLAGIKGKFLLSINDTPFIRSTFAAFSLQAVNTRYSCSTDRNYQAAELLISNY